MRPPSLFDSFQDYTPRSTWVPEAPPDVSDEQEVFVNFETNGLRWWGGDLPIGVNTWAKGRAWYLPFRHLGGGNLDESQVYRWVQSLKGKRIVNTNTRFELHMARCWGEKMGSGGLDLDAMGCTFGDVAHQAALLDDHRLHLSLDSLIVDYLGEQPMARVNEQRMVEYHAGEVAARAMYGIEAVKRLQDVFWPMLTEQDLHRVRQLEEDVLPVTVECEKNGSPIDVELLDRWLTGSQRKLEGYLWQIAKDLGWPCNPDSPKDMERAFKQLCLPIERTKGTIRKPGGSPSFTSEILSNIDHPTVRTMLLATKLASLRSKFLIATKKLMGKNGVLYYALHQLRATKDDSADAGEAGTVTGRYSSSALEKYAFGVNIQQRMKAAKQRTVLGFDENDTSQDDELYIVRKLHVASLGYKVLASDMDQAQYRIFASYANNPRIIQAYRENPDLSFHKFMWALIKPYADLTYRQQKDTNFAYLFGAGLAKMGWMLHHINKQEFEEIRHKRQYDHPKLAVTKEVRRIYEREVPEMKDLLDEAAHLAKPECDDRCKKGDKLHRSGLKHRGFVKDAIGRRMRFPDGQRLHKAFNGVDQMTEASYMKTKMVELHKVRHETGFIMRITNHDELVGDIVDREHADKVNEILNRQSFPQLRVPLTWSTGIGPNWAETK